MSKFKFSVGPWNVHAGADSYGPETRSEIDLETKFAKFAELGFSAIQFHDDDAVPDMNNMSDEEIIHEIELIAQQYNVKLTNTQKNQLLTLCRSLEGLDAESLKSRVEDVQDTLKKVANAKTQVVGFVEKAKKVVESVSSFFDKIKDIIGKFG